MKRPAATTILTYFIYAALAAAVVFGFVVQQDRITEATERYDSLFASYQELDRDCAEAADCFTEAPAADEVAPGPAGANGAPGPTGPQGLPGADGTDGTTPPAGSDGTDGKNGPAGPAGKDGAPGANGADGKDGTNGADGSAGKDGTDGKPPFSWTYTTTRGTTYTCNRTDPFDASAPTYTCTPQGVTP